MPSFTPENPLHHHAFDFFRRKGMDVDWVKSQVYGVNPEKFPENVSTLDDILKRIPSK